MTTSNNKPIQTIRDGALKASIWANPNKKGVFYSVRISRTYKDAQDQYRDTDSFSNAELLRVARLANIAYDEIAILRGHDPETATANGGSS